MLLFHCLPLPSQSEEEQSPFLHDGLSLKDLVLLGEIIDKLSPAKEHQVSVHVHGHGHVVRVHVYMLLGCRVSHFMKYTANIFLRPSFAYPPSSPSFPLSPISLPLSLLPLPSLPAPLPLSLSPLSLPGSQGAVCIPAGSPRR